MKSSRLNKGWNIFKEILSYVLSSVGIIVSAIGLGLDTDKITNRLFFGTLIMCFIIVMIHSVFVTIFVFISNMRVSTEKQEIVILKNELAAIKNQSHETYNSLTKFIKSVSKSLDTFLQKVYDENDKYFDKLEEIAGDYEKITDKSEYEETYINRVMEAKKQHKIATFSIYNAYMRRAVSDTKVALQAYLSAKNIDLSVSISLKLLDCAHEVNDAPSKKSVFTAFRDEESFNDGDREIGGTKYTIMGNTAFSACLTKERFITNNVHRGATDYNNEHKDFDAYYNCAITVPVFCGGSSSAKTIYGFFCCDVLNKSECGADIEVFDRNSSDILFSSASSIATFFDNTNLPWDNENEESLSQYIYNTICKCK